MKQEKHYFKRCLSLLLSLVMSFSVFAGLDITVSAVDSLDYLSYEISDGEVTITDCDEAATEIVIPETIEGYPVTSIEQYAFYDCYDLTSIVIPEGVLYIGYAAFADCSLLTSISLPDSLTYISDFVFNYTGYYDDSSNWVDDVLYIGNHLIEAEDTISGDYIIKSGTKTISSCAFLGCSSLSSVIIPDSVVSIGDNAFDNCRSLCKISIPDSVVNIGESAFGWCSSLTSITLSKNIESIGQNAFEGCRGLLSITIDENNPNYCSNDGVLFDKNKTNLIQYPASKTETEYTIPHTVTNICDYAFYGCSTLTSIMIPDGVTKIGHSAFRNCSLLTSITIPDGVVSIGRLAFDDCKSLTSVTIPSSVTSIERSAFGNCTSLTSITVDSNNKTYSSVDGVLFNVDKTELIQYPNGKNASTYTIPDGVLSIGDSAFKDCESLISVIIGDSVTNIGEVAFYGCSSLTEITIPNSVANIYSHAFAYCYDLTSVKYSGTLNDWVSINFEDSNSNPIKEADGLYINNTLVTEISFDDGLTIIKPYSFYGYRSLTAVTIPDTVTEIGGYAFYDCYDLASVTFGENVKIIGGYAFNDCYDLITVILPDSITEIGNSAFAGCDSLTSIKIPSSITEIKYEAFDSCDSLCDVYYAGTQSEWEAISINSSNTNLTDANIHFETQSDHYMPKNTVAPTCTESGSITYQCDCGYEKTVEVPALGHSDIEGICSVCGVCVFEYEIDESNEITIISYSGTADLIAIPEEIEGYPVTKIAEYAFAERGIMTDGEICSIKIPATITDIGEYAFAISAITSINVDENNPNYCSVDGVLFNKDKTELIQYPISNERTEYVIPDGVTNIAAYAFCFSQSLISVTIPDSVTSIEELAFYECTSLATIKGGNNLIYMGLGVFNETAYINDKNNYIDGVMYVGSFLLKADNDLLPAKYTIIDGTKVISALAFMNCTSLSFVQIPGSVTEIGDMCFFNCDNLVSITVDENNGGYCSVDGILFNKNKTELIQYPAGKTNTSYEIPNGVNRVSAYSFLYCSSLEKITLPNTVTDIGPAAFSMCQSLTAINIPDSVIRIGALAFGGCSALTTINLPCNLETIEYMPEGILSAFLGSDSLFDSCDSLVSITVDEANQNFCSIDGVLFNKDKTVLYQYPIGKTETSYSIPNGVMSIDTLAFYRCDSLKSVLIPGSLNNIDEQAFRRLENLTDIYYTGTESEWDLINISWGNDVLYSAKIHYNSGLCDMIGHTVVTDTAVSPTCTQTGLTEGSHCSVCDEVIVAQEEIPVIDHEYDNGTVTKQATCTDDGVKTYKCKHCEDSYTEVVNATGHTVVIDTAVAPACTQTGLTEGKHCSVCGEIIIAQEVIPATGHTEIIDEAVAATCTQIGLTEGSHCSVCNEIIVGQEVIPATGHTEVIDEAVAATCTATGLTEGKHCSVCNEIIVGQEVIPTTGHTEVIDEAVTATCTATGLTEGKHCSVCNEVIVSQEVVPATGHTEVIDEAVAATCTETGLTEGNHCSVCGEILVAQEVIPALGHDYADGICTMCDDWSGTEKEVKLKSATNVTGGVKISWSAIPGAEKYVIYRKTSAKADWKKLYTTKTPASAYTDKAAKSGTKYYYTVKAVRDGEYSKYDNDGVSRTYLAAPKISSVSNKSSYVEIKWGKVTGASSYDVYRKVKGGSWAKLDSTKSTTFKDKTAKAGKVYEYKVRAKVGKSTTSEFSSVKKIVRLTTPKLTKVTPSKGKVTFTFGKVTGAEKYYIYRKTGSGSYKKIATTTSTKYVDKSVKKGTTYTYTVKAVKSSYSSTYNSTGLKVKAK